MSAADWDAFVLEVAGLAGIGPEAIAPDDPVVESGLLDSLAVTELCVMVLHRSGQDLLDADGSYRYPGMTWRGLYELCSPGTVFIDLPT
ncbi:acyl carrier protein [Baekduia sp.]|jgi:hypothetical protein|uniref:acyl carrier protein n=1 Tax=Baekduia sp. TaxID=2600305 RepID=UPI002DFE182B|nr:acyl carrier protein [Baekduia sp.]